MKNTLSLCLFLAMAFVAAPAAQAALSDVGPLNPANGYPFYYQDQAGMRLELCLEPANPTSLCIVDETTTPVFPTNWAVEHFWYFSEADFSGNTVDSVGNPVNMDAIHDRVRFEQAVEATFGADAVVDGDQISFTRLRIRFDNLVVGAEYTFDYPYGSITLEAVQDDPGIGEIDYTSDIGIGAPGTFDGALQGSIGPNFLTWDTYGQVVDAPPLGYIGDPNVAHRVTGGVGDFNKVAITGPNIGGPGVNYVETEFFFLAGKIATNFGAELARATYSRKAAGSGRVDVMANSIDNQLLTSDIGADEALLEWGTNGDYFLRHPFDPGQLPANIELANRSDNPDTIYDPVAITDVVTIERAEFLVTNTDGSGVLYVKAHSSDQDASLAPTLGVHAPDGSHIADLTNGVLANHALAGPPAFVRVLSTAGGEQTVPVDVLGPAVQGP